MRVALALLLCCACRTPARPSSPTADELEFHRRALVVDAHSDVTEAVRYEQYDLGIRHQDHHEDIPRMREGGLSAEFLSIFVQPGRFRAERFFDEAQTQIDAVRKAVAAHPGELALARTAREVRENARGGLISILLGVEGAHMLLPGTDPVTTLIEMVPLLVLYELSILLASWLDRLSARRELAAPKSDETSPDAV